MWGRKKRLYILSGSTHAGYVVLLFLFRNGGFTPDFFALTITAVLAGWLIFKSKWEKNEYYYFFFIDGVLMLQYLVLLLFNYLSTSL